MLLVCVYVSEGFLTRSACRCDALFAARGCCHSYLYLRVLGEVRYKEWNASIAFFNRGVGWGGGVEWRLGTRKEEAYLIQSHAVGFCIM